MMNFDKIKKHKLFKFELAGIFFTLYGLGWSICIDVFDLSATVMFILTFPIIHIIRYFVYSRVVFKHG